MSLAVWKFPLQSRTKLLIPEGARILTAQPQHDDLYLWVLVDPSRSVEPRYFEVYGTGHDIPDLIGNHVYIATAQMADGSLVWHVFEIVKSDAQVMA